MNEAGDPLVESLRVGLAGVRRDVDDAERAVGLARDRLAQAIARHDDFIDRLGAACVAIGVSVEAVTAPADAGTGRTSRAEAEEQAVIDINQPFDNPLALPSAPLSLRWFAGQVLHLLGETSVGQLAAEMRRRGYEHSHDPSNPKQLEQSLAALPNQLSWIVRGRVPGTLALAPDKLNRRRR